MSRAVPREALRPVPWRDFVLGFNVASQTLEPPSDCPELPAPETDGERDPFTRVLMAVREHFGAEYRHLGCFIHRFWALIELVHAGHVDAWLTRPETGSQAKTLHPALLLAAAEVKLTRNARFPVKRFLARVEEIVRTEGGDRAT